jgi:hypothetical protein
MFGTHQSSLASGEDSLNFERVIFKLQRAIKSLQKKAGVGD